MILPYRYRPSRDDLWVYEDHVVTWTDGGGGSMTVKRPVGWNSGSPLYPYRSSIVGLSARYRTNSTASTAGQRAPYLSYNDQTDPANDPNYYNSYPPGFAVVSDRMMYGCRHCFFAMSARDTTKFLVGAGGYPDSMAAALLVFRWLGADDSVLDSIEPEDIYLPFTSDPPNLVAMQSDSCCFEPIRSLSVPPVSVGDCTNIGAGQTNAWIVDGNDKVIRAKIQYAYNAGSLPYFRITTVTPTGAAPPLQPLEFTHDSGSRIFVEVSPASSASAGDGVVAMLPVHTVNAGYFTDGFDVAGYERLSGTGWLATTNPVIHDFRAYCFRRGHPMNPLLSGRRTDTKASQTTQADILVALTDL